MTVIEPSVDRAAGVEDGKQAERVEVVIVGGGPAGLTAAETLARGGAGRVVVLEREAQPGGIPRHARHQGFGLRDLHRSLTGPRYAERRVDLAAAAGADLRTSSSVTGWSIDGSLDVTSPHGRSRVHAQAVLLATGCRERPRAARLVPGARPQGVVTTGLLQQLVYLHGLRPGSRAVVVGAEHVSFSALLTLHHGGARAVAMVTEHARHQSFAAFRLGAALRFRAPLLTESVVTVIHGRRRVEGVELTHLRTGHVQSVPCDLVVFTADWIPDHELAVLGGATLDRGTRGPAVDHDFRTTRRGLFAAGNVLHGAETADVAALSGRSAAAAVLRYLDDERWPAARVAVECEPPLHWIWPNAVAPTPSSRPSSFLLRARELLGTRRVEVQQDGRRLYSRRTRRLLPGRSARLPADWVKDVAPDGGPVIVRVGE